MPKGSYEDPLLAFLKRIVGSKPEIEILEMIFDDLDDEQIIERLIDFKPMENDNAKV